MAAAATRDWRIGEGMYGAESDYKSMRNIAKPNDRTAIHGLYTTMNEIHEVRSQGGEAEEHWASGVLSTAAYRMQQRIGGEEGWRAVEQVYYNAIDPQRLGDMSFTAVASGLRSSAAATYGGESFEYQVVDYELG
ncbi:MAG: M4 family metallopeptidase, partial [Gaiellales bacterium]